MVQPTGEDSSRPEAEQQQQGMRLSGGAIASLGGVAALVIFMSQNTEDVTVQFLGGSSPGRSGCSSSSPRSSARSCGSAWAYCDATDGEATAATNDETD